MQLVRHELIGETAGERHQVVGGDGAGDSDTHGGSAPAGRGGWARVENETSHTTLPGPDIAPGYGFGHRPDKITK
ncbi:hypothetical protein GCM10010324_48030 [Streptomyces hiroshimensis]|uniref:Uncharacterized protein n=1 Tax=Streptomyces hiroshimensis TaxID=66424 RepID=A0ABQ2YX43_9ACTN|nr:hypothetical protein GCM10010324_48030 [Streptomyces hiroshimensis]